MVASGSSGCTPFQAKTEWSDVVAVLFIYILRGWIFLIKVDMPDESSGLALRRGKEFRSLDSR